MVVYWEYAFLENAVLDGLLLYLAVKCARMRARPLRLLAAAALGGAFAVVFPLILLPGWAAYAVKFLSGAAIVLIAASGKRARGYLVSVASFFALTFALGGLLTAVYSFFDIETADGTGFYLERAPVALIVGGSGAFAVCVLAGARALWKYRAVRRNVLHCVLTEGERSVTWEGFADSGNCLTFRGEPVCVVSAAGIFALFGAHPKEEGRLEIGTVNGRSSSPVFRCDSLKIGAAVHKGIFLTVGDVGGKYPIILHTALTEGYHEHILGIKAMAAEHRVGQRCPLSVRKRGTSAPAPSGARGGTSLQAGSGGGDGDRQSEAHRT